MISIIIPTYNRLVFLKECIDSIIEQTLQDWEIIVVDDDSEDKTEQMILELAGQNPRITFNKRQGLPKGANTCRNIGIERATGDYIIFLDSDDLLKPFALQQRMQTIDKFPDYDYWIFQTIRFKDKPENEQKCWNKETEEENLARFLNLDSVWHTTGPIWKASKLKENLRFDEKLTCWQDVDFHLQALEKKLKYKCFFDLPADVLYRQHLLDSISQKAFSKNKRKSQIYFIKKYYHLLKEHKYRLKLKNIVGILSKKNAESRYVCNLLDITFWAYRTRNLNIIEIFKIYRQLF